MPMISFKEERERDAFGVATSKPLEHNIKCFQFSEYVKSTTSFGSICLSTPTYICISSITTYNPVSSVIRKAKVA